ncbi:hydrogen gas-evolving membrane-bound hydrogenase subunit E [Desulfofustis glycolicus]|nr:hydrogen gas-evolving membrane-bound hydrogenase subunit E [Desulfofustis glycolicus]
MGRLSSLLPALLFILTCRFWPAIVDGQTYLFDAPWLPSLDLSLRFRLDGLSLLFALIITGAGTFVSLYSSSYLGGHRHCGRYFFFLHAFMLSMLGLVLADNLLLLFVFWEGTTIFSFLLIGFDHESKTARENARQSLLVTGGGGLALLLGILLLKIAGGSYIISSWPAAGEMVRQHHLYPFILLAVLLGAMTKSAQFPFHFWLPNAMSAPTPISAFLHAATMVKAGIYLLMRCHPLLGGTPAWTTALVLIGGFTAVWGAVQALGPRDLKRILAYTTIMALGILTMFLGGQTAPALTAAVTFLMVHALYKAALFLAVGSIDHSAGSRIIDSLGGLWRAMPLTAVAVGAACLSMAGFPLFFGFIGKEIMYEGALAKEMYPVFAVTAAVLANALMTAVAAIVLFGPFFGSARAPRQQIHESPWTMWLGPLVLGGVGILFGLIPEWVSRVLIEPAVRSFHPGPEEIRLVFFHGLNLPLLLSLVTLCCGATLYLLRHRACRLVATVVEKLPATFEGLYNLGLSGFMNGAGLLTGRLQNGSLHFYLAVIVSTVILGVGWPWIGKLSGIFGRWPESIDTTALALLLFVSGSVFVVVTARKRLAAIGGLGGVGAGVALIFLLFGAPDIAMTQLLVETLTVIFVSLVMLRLPAIEQARRRTVRRRCLDGGLALAGGLLLTSLLIGVGSEPLDRSLTSYFEANSYLAAHGRNIVNVILVDFRSFDTLGEIIVVVLAAWAAVTLIRKPMEP